MSAQAITMDPTVIGIVIAYLGLMLWIGWYASKRITKNEDFMIAGRGLGPIMMAGTLAATEIGGGSSMGVAEKAYGNWGLSAGWYVLTMTITFFILATIAPKLREAMVKTVPEYFRKRYGRAPGLMTAIIMLLPLIGLTAIQIIASATILKVMTGFTYVASVLIVVVVVTIYSVMGGLWSVTMTDVVQMVLILVGLFVAVPYAISAAGGWETMVATIPPERMSPTQGMGWATGISLVIMYVTSFSVGQEAVQRFYAAKDGKAAFQGSIIAGLIYLVFAFVPAILGLAAWSMVQGGQIDGALIAASGTRYVLPVLATHVLPAWLTGIVFAALISATMSSADSDLLAAGSIFSNDIYSQYIRPEAEDKEILKVTRITMVVIAFLAMIVALTNTKNIISILMFSFTLRAGGAFFPYVMGHFWKKASWAGSMASIIVGSITVLVADAGYFTFYGLKPIIPGLLASLVLFIIFSYIFPDPEIIETEMV